MSPEERRVKRNGSAKVLDTCVKITSFCEKLSKIAVDLSVVRIDPQCLFEVTLRLCKLTLSSIDIADVVMSDPVVRFYLDGLKSCLNSLLDPALLVVGIG